MFQTLDVIISLAVIFLILSMALKFFMSMIKRGLKTKAKVISEEMRVFIGENTSKYLIPFLDKQARYLNFLEVLKKPDKKSGKTFGLRQLTKKQLEEMVSDFSKFLENKKIDKIKKILELDDAEGDLNKKIREIKAHLKRLKLKIENNYDNTTRKIAERYESRLGYYSLIFGLIFALMINGDFFEMYSSLSKNSVITAELSARADSIGKRISSMHNEVKSKEEKGFEGLEDAEKEIVKGIDKLSAELANTGISLGWKKHHLEKTIKFVWNWPDEKERNVPGWLSNLFVSKGKELLVFFKKVMGIFISGLLISFGAPFWHDFLESVTGIRRLLVSKRVDKNNGETQKPRS